MAMAGGGAFVDQDSAEVIDSAVLPLGRQVGPQIQLDGEAELVIRLDLAHRLRSW